MLCLALHAPSSDLLLPLLSLDEEVRGQCRSVDQSATTSTYQLILRCWSSPGWRYWRWRRCPQRGRGTRRSRWVYPCRCAQVRVTVFVRLGLTSRGHGHVSDLQPRHRSPHPGDDDDDDDDDNDDDEGVGPLLVLASRLSPCGETPFSSPEGEDRCSGSRINYPRRVLHRIPVINPPKPLNFKSCSNLHMRDFASRMHATYFLHRSSPRSSARAQTETSRRAHTSTQPENIIPSPTIWVSVVLLLKTWKPPEPVIHRRCCPLTANSHPLSSRL